ncbi:hypothetical protein ABPG75_008138 [Micractinium tetrahymenae]
MAQPALRLPPVVGGNSSSEGSAGADSGPSGLLIGVRLVGAAQRPVSADLAVQQALGAALPALAGPGRRSGDSSVAAGWAPADTAQLWLEPPQLRWEAGEAGLKWARLRSTAELPLTLVLEGPGNASGADVAAASVQQGQTVLRVHLAGATGAAISAAPLNATEVLLGGGNGSSNGTAGGPAGASSLPLFGFIANQVAYPPSSTSSSRTGGSNTSAGEAAIPVRLLAGQLDGPATLRYTLRLLPPDAPHRAQRPPQFLPAKAMQGFLHFLPAPAGSGDNSSSGGSGQQAAVEQQILLPLAWDRIPPEAEYHLGLELEGMYDACVVSQPGAVALHVFGIPAGSCPPGAALRMPGNRSASGVPLPARSRPGSSDSAGGLVEPPVGGNGSAGFLLSPNGTVIDISRNLLPGVHDYGAMVEADVAQVTLCIRVDSRDADAQAGAGTVTSLQVAGRQEEAEELEPAPGDVAEEACGCDSGSSGDDGGEEGGGCEYAAWELPLLPGQNMFNVTLVLPANSSINGAGESTSGGSSSDVDGAMAEHPASLAVVRLADPDHAELETITVRASDDRAVVLCGPPAASSTHTINRAALGLTPGQRAGIVLPRSPPPCEPGVLLSLNVSDSNRMVTLTPALKRPGVPGIRVEVNGQVLSRGGDVHANQLQDTTAAVEPQPSNASFLPSAFIMGLQPGGKLGVEVVVVAEDGVTTNRYPLQFVLVESQERLAPAGATDSSGDNSSAYAAAEEGRRRGWPLSPAQQPTCTICPAGWAAETVNSTECHMCPPGTFAPWPQSAACQSCPPGKFAYSWCSSYCKNCIEGTYAPAARTSLCSACPSGRTTIDDGSSSCIPTSPGGYIAPRYAVVVSFYVNLSGLELEDVVMRAGVNGDPEAIISSLLRSDTALAFNISRDDVEVVAMRQVARRTLSANVTAMLGVDVPPGATEEEIAAALEVERLSADKPIEMLSEDPDRFFGRTTQALEVQVESGMHATLSTVAGPPRAGLIWAMLAPGIVAIVAGSGLVAVGCRRSKACARWRANSARRLATTRLTPLPQRYARYSGSSSSGSDDSSQIGSGGRSARGGGEGPS